jgi:hypothetical protein
MEDQQLGPTPGFFIGHFQGTYTRPGNACELLHCQQKKGESLYDYIHRFSKRWPKFPTRPTTRSSPLFQDGTTCEILMHRIG